MQRADRQIRRQSRYSRYIVETDAPSRRSLWVHHDVGAYFCLPKIRHLADVAHRSNALGEIEVGGVVKIGERNGIRGQTENQHRMVGRIHLAVLVGFGIFFDTKPCAGLIPACTSLAAPAR